MKQETILTLIDEIDRLDALSKRLASRLFYLAIVAGICGGLLLGVAAEHLITQRVAAMLEGE